MKGLTPCFQLIESMRWANGKAVCPHCGCMECFELVSKPDSKNKVTPGTYKCSACRKKFTVRVGTIFEDSKIGLGKWLMAIFLMCSSKKAISAHQLHRNLGITYKSAWFMCHRIRHGMADGDTMENVRGIVEVDETYVGGKPRKGGEGRYKKFKAGRGTKKIPVMALVPRDGKARGRVLTDVKAETLRKELEALDSSCTIHTDDWTGYRRPCREMFAGHKIVRHTHGEYSIKGGVHTNTVESFFALLKRGVYGTYHHISRKHMQLYVDEFCFRWNNRTVSDGERTGNALKGFEGKRLTYRGTTKQ